MDWPDQSSGYQFISPLGQGSFGIVWKAQVLSGSNQHQFVAIKRIELEKCNQHKVDEISKNLILVSKLKHYNLLCYKTAFLTNKQVWIIYDVMDCGSIENILQFHYPKGIKDMQLIAQILIEVLEGIKYLHQNGQIHRDIKSSNILLSQTGRITLSDFGLTVKLGKNKKRNTLVGSPCWMAPEVFSNEDMGYDYKVDIWSFGITALELVNGAPPYFDEMTMKVIIKIVDHDPPKISKFDYDESFVELIEACLKKDPKQRKTAEELMKMSFFKKCKNENVIIQKLVKNIQPLDQRMAPSLKLLAQDELQNLDQPKQQKPQTIQWDTDLSGGSKINDLNDQQIQQSNYKKKDQIMINKCEGDDEELQLELNEEET